MTGELESSDDIVIAENLKQEVKQFTPEQISALGKKEHVLDTFINGLDAIATAVTHDTRVWSKVVTNVGRILHGQRQFSTEERVAYWMWNIDDVARSFLTKPLPKQAFQYKEGELDEITGLPPTPDLIKKAQVADSINNWWSILSPDQKNALSKIVGLDLTVGERYQPPEDLENKNHIILQGPLIRFGEIGQKQSQFYPVVVWQGEGAYGLSALPKRVERSFHNPLERIGHAARSLQAKVVTRRK